MPVDDAYCQLETAWNVSRLGFVTFDGMHRANGLQFLWLLAQDVSQLHP